MVIYLNVDVCIYIFFYQNWFISETKKRLVAFLIKINNQDIYGKFNRIIEYFNRLNITLFQPTEQMFKQNCHYDSGKFRGIRWDMPCFIANLTSYLYGPANSSVKVQTFASNTNRYT